MKRVMIMQRCLLAGLLLCSAACGVTEVVDRSLDGEAVLVRSPQPDDEDLARLHDQYGIKTVINLRGEKPGASWFEEERQGVENIKAQWIHLAVSGRRRPAPEVVKRFFEIVEKRENWPILMHCQGGVHRTGFMTALYRIQYQGWSAEDAIAEMDEKYFRWGVTDRSALKTYLRGYRPRVSRQLPGQSVRRLRGESSDSER